MEKRMVQVQMNGKQIQVPEGTTYRETVELLEGKSENPAVLVKSNGRLAEMMRTVSEDCNLELIRINEENGFQTYRRSMILLLLSALNQEMGEKTAAGTILHNSAANGFFFELGGKQNPDQALLDRLTERMQDMISRKMPIRKETLPVWKARRFFEKCGMQDKADLLRFRISSWVNVYELAGFTDYFYGYMVPDTGYLGTFTLSRYENGFLLLLPERSDMQVLPEFRNSPKVFRTQMETAEWGARLNINTVGDLDKMVCEGGVENTILFAEALQEGKISDIAGEIVDRKTVKFVLIAGPSSSGKTTFSRRLSIQLRAHGLRPHPISMDNYYLNRVDTPRDENGEYDFECLEAIDVPLFNRDMKRLMDGEKVELPYYNFVTGCREYRGDFLQMKQGDILVLEGIHGLNERLTEMLPSESKFRIYISALTQLNIDHHNRIPTTDGRLIRRIVRDYRTRGTSARETIARWPSVRRGEEKNIFPFQEQADVTFNSALIYELAVLKTSIVPLLYQIPEDAPEYSEAKRLLKFLDYFVAIPSEEIPNNSILREFVGGGCFKL